MGARASGGRGADAGDVTVIPSFSLWDNTGASLLHPLVLFPKILRTAGSGLYATTTTVFEVIDWQWRWASVQVAGLKPILSVVGKAHLAAGFYDRCE